VYGTAGPYTHTPQVKNYAAKHRPSTRQNFCGSLRVISVKHSSVFPDDGSHKIRNMSEWCLIFLIFCVLNFYTTKILTFKFCATECISRTIEVIDYNNARWNPETNDSNSLLLYLRRYLACFFVLSHNIKNRYCDAWSSCILVKSCSLSVPHFNSLVA